MTFQARRGDYIRVKNGRYYYRRAIPKSHQSLLGGKKEWVIALAGENDTERKRAAQALAAQHDQILTAEIVDDPTNYQSRPADAGVMYAENSEQIFYHQGGFIQPEKFAVSHHPSEVRKAKAKGYFAMSEEEYELQRQLEKRLYNIIDAENDDKREIADLKAERLQDQITKVSETTKSESILSVLEPWRANRKQAATTWKKHNQYANEFAELHGDLALIEVTKRHVVEYVAHCQTLTYLDKPISPTSISKRLDSIKALLSFAVSADLIPYNPAQGVKPPRDTRPKTAKSWKSFEKQEIQKLLTTAETLWTSRRQSRNAGRRDDLITALHTLVWTGARPEEICQLRRSDIDLARNAIVITNDETDDAARQRLVKNERSTRLVPIHSALLPRLKEHLQRSNSPLLFPSFEPKPTKTELSKAKETGQPVVVNGRYARVIPPFVEAFSTRTTQLFGAGSVSSRG